MTFNKQNCDFVLESILSKLHFSGNDIKSVHDWSLIVDLPIQDLINKRPDEAEEIRFIVKALEAMNYVKFKENDMSIIQHITSSGYKWIFKTKYNMPLD